MKPLYQIIILILGLCFLALASISCQRVVRSEGKTDTVVVPAADSSLVKQLK